MAQVNNLLRAGWIGGAAGMVIGGGVLFYVGILRVFGAIDCAGMTAEECALEHTMYKSIGNMQTVAGIALVMLGLALYVLWRRPAAPQEKDGTNP